MNRFEVIAAVLVLGLVGTISASKGCTWAESDDSLERLELYLKKSKSSLKLNSDKIIEQAKNWFAKQSHQCPKSQAGYLDEVKLLEILQVSDCNTGILDEMRKLQFTLFYNKKGFLLNKALLEKMTTAMTKCSSKFKDLLPIKRNEILSEDFENLIKSWAEADKHCNWRDMSDPNWYHLCLFYERDMSSIGEELIAKMLIEKKGDELKDIDLMSESKVSDVVRPMIWYLFREDCARILPAYKGLAYNDVFVRKDPITRQVDDLTRLMNFVYRESNGDLSKRKLPIGLETDLMLKMDSYLNLCGRFWSSSFYEVEEKVVKHAKSQRKQQTSV